MNITIAITLAVSALMMLLMGITYLYSDESFGGILLVVLLLSVPMLIAQCMVCFFCRTHFGRANPVLHKIGLYAFIATTCVYVYWNGLMFLDVWQKGYLSEAQGYTGLILWLGGPWALSIGAAIGVSLHFLPIVIAALKNKLKSLGNG
ncbi:hypothetical protein [Pseudoalteromonas rubra]|uniref:Transmembrane protein n=1 Tax=Pseudoalteromonas rubra TaxID=43658 RepID=A0A5S3X2L8_9GAMM|nr:hypothetical protein [Pseudoalteromonas rubra]TMP38367.1 hypothetical protein CWB98_06445 [Pseudoalteromonas rubra]